MMCYCCKQEPFNQFTYAIVGDGTATSLFDINENTGDIKVKEGLATDTDLSYVVCRCIYSFHLLHYEIDSRGIALITQIGHCL